MSEVDKLIGVELVLSGHSSSHLELKESGYGEFPDSYKLTEAGAKKIIQALNITTTCK